MQLEAGGATKVSRRENEDAGGTTPLEGCTVSRCLWELSVCTEGGGTAGIGTRVQQSVIIVCVCVYVCMCVCLCVCVCVCRQAFV
jgi:hypothetical protein